jgi:hypothetical protein
MAATGNSSTIVFGTSGFVAHYHTIGGSEQARKKIITSHLGTTNYDTHIPGDLVDPGEVNCQFEYDPDANPPILAAPESITITFPIPAGRTHGATLAGTGFIMKRKSAELKNGELMVGTFTVAWDGGTGPTFTASS